MRPGLPAGCWGWGAKRPKKDQHNKKKMLLGRLEDLLYWTETVETKDDSHSVFHPTFII